jgi:hypothetical protein
MVMDDVIYMYVLAGRSFQLGFVGLWFLSQLGLRADVPT